MLTVNNGQLLTQHNALLVPIDTILIAIKDVFQ